MGVQIPLFRFKTTISGNILVLLHLLGVLRIMRLKVYCGQNPLMHVLTVTVQPKQWHLTKNLFGEGGSAKQLCLLFVHPNEQNGKVPICAGIFAYFQK